MVHGMPPWLGVALHIDTITRLSTYYCFCLWYWQRHYTDEVSKAFEAAAATDANKPTLFSRIIDRSVPAKIIYEDDLVSLSPSLI